MIVNHRESNAEERQVDSDIEYNLDKAREQLENLLKNQSEKGKSWVDIKGNPYLKVATLFRVLRDVFKHNLRLKTKVVYDGADRIVISAMVSDLTGRTLASGIAERWKNP